MITKDTIQPMLVDWLLAVAWGTDLFLFPTWGKLNESFEGWKHRHRFRNQLRYLEQRAFIRRERQAQRLVYRITELGRLAAVGGRDPEVCWGRAWDGKWRMVLFDLPVGRQVIRQRLLRWLRQNGFGYLQNSVWIHPDPLSDVARALDDYRDDVESLTIVEARCCTGCANDAIVRGAWYFDEINQRYKTYLEGFGKRVPKLVGGRLDFAQASQWVRSERIAWTNAVSLDPFLPRALLPQGYLGVAAWQARRRLQRAVAEQVAAVS